MGKSNLITALSISTVLLVGGGNAYAKQIQIDESVKPVQIVNTQTNETTTQESKEQPTQFSYTDEAFFTTSGQPDYFANEFLNNKDLFSLLNMNGTELQQELATGKSVVDIASSKNVSAQQVIEVITKAQIEVQIADGESGEGHSKDIEVKTLYVIEHKNN